MNKPKVAITDYTFGNLDVERALLEAAGCEVVGAQCRTPAELVELVRDADAVITQFAPVDAGVVGAMEKARVIVRYGVGYDNVAVEAARARGIPVCNIPDYCIDEVADHTLAMMLALARQVLPNALAIRQGEWKLAVPLEELRTLRHMTVGIVGFGRIGREVVRRVGAFGSRVLVADPLVDPEAIRAAGAEPAGLDELLAAADLVSLHCPTTDATRQMINAQTLARMKRGVLLVNLGRGGLVDGPALIEALRSGHVAGAALDVYDPEPMPADCPLRTMENVIVHSHIASASPRAVRVLRETAAQVALKALKGEPLPNVVNAPVGG
jgi:D-3-phosphoglycerate dehydrogenase